MVDYNKFICKRLLRTAFVHLTKTLNSVLLNKCFHTFNTMKLFLLFPLDGLMVTDYVLEHWKLQCQYNMLIKMLANLATELRN